MSYEDGDAAMNAIFHLMLTTMENGHPAAFVEPHGQSISPLITVSSATVAYCPVETFLVRTIRNILGDAQQLIEPERK